MLSPVFHFRIKNVELKIKIEKTANLQGVSIDQFALYAFTKGISDIETDQFFKKRLKKNTKDEIESDFLKIWNKLSLTKLKNLSRDKI